jgi:hypothetical protein
VQAGVGLDADALAKVGDLAGALEVDDLRQSGWKVVGPEKEDDGFTWVRASKPFSGPAQAERVLAELSGPNGPFRDMRLSQTRSFFHTQTKFSGTADLSGGLSGFLDPDLQQRLGDGGPLDLDALSRRDGSAAADVVQVEVVADLPGSIRSDGEAADGGARWVIAPGGTVVMEASAEATNLLPWLPAIGACVAAAAAVVLVLVRRRRSAR